VQSVVAGRWGEAEQLNCVHEVIGDDRVEEIGFPGRQQNWTRHEETMTPTLTVGAVGVRRGIAGLKRMATGTRTSLLQHRKVVMTATARPTVETAPAVAGQSPSWGDRERLRLSTLQPVV